MKKDPTCPYEVWIQVEIRHKELKPYPPFNINQVSIGEAFLWYIQERRKWLEEPDSAEKEWRLWQLEQWKEALQKRIKEEEPKWK